MIKKEGGKVNGFNTNKKWILGAKKAFNVTTRMGHLIICYVIHDYFIFILETRVLVPENTKKLFKMSTQHRSEKREI